MSKERQRARKKAAQARTRKPAHRPDGSLEEGAWVALKRHIVEPFQVQHEDADPEPPSVALLDRLFDLGFRWSPDRKASFVPVSIEDLAIEQSFEPAEMQAGIDELAAAHLLTVEGQMVRLIVDAEVLARVNRGERLL